MSEFLNVPDYFSAVYLIDFSPSLCDVARKRFARLGWPNVKVICEDARKFRLENYESKSSSEQDPSQPATSLFDDKRPEHGGADLITMSYSLSMMVSLALVQYSRHRTNDFSAGLLLDHRFTYLPTVT